MVGGTADELQAVDELEASLFRLKVDGEHAAGGLAELQRCGLLQLIIPELAALASWKDSNPSPTWSTTRTAWSRSF